MRNHFTDQIAANMALMTIWSPKGTTKLDSKLFMMSKMTEAKWIQNWKITVT